MKHCLLCLLSLCSLLCHAQHSSPGGVGNADLLEFWFSASSNTYANGQVATAFADLSGNGNDLGASGQNRPQPTYSAANAGANNLPSLTYNGTTELESAYVGNSNNTMSFITVLRRAPDRRDLNAVALQHGGRNTVAFRNNTQRNFVGGADNTNNTTSPHSGLAHRQHDCRPYYPEYAILRERYRTGLGGL